MHLVHRTGRGYHDAPQGFGCGNRVEPRAQPLVKTPVKPLEPVGAAWPQGCSRKTLFDRQVED